MAGVSRPGCGFTTTTTSPVCQNRGASFGIVSQLAPQWCSSARSLHAACSSSSIPSTSSCCTWGAHTHKRNLRISNRAAGSQERSASSRSSWLSARQCCNAWRQSMARHRALQPRLGGSMGIKTPTRCLSDTLLPLGLDFLTFLAATVLVIPLFKSVNASPVLGFLFSGLVLGQLGLFRNIEEIEKLSELGVLFLLFEMGLELSLDRLKGLAKYAFGLGTLQMLLCTAAFTVFALPVGNGVGTQILIKIFHASPQLASIRTVDEAVVIGAALSLSSSAFVLQLLAERGELPTRFGSATLGILLLQDIAVVPFLVLLPLIESTDLEAQSTMGLLQALGPVALTTLGGLGLLLLGGRIILRRIFELVAEARSDETFVALCLLTVTGASLLTQKLGFSDTMGAFVAGVLLAETNFRTQVEADIRPFRGMLLGLFFVTTGSSLDLQLFFKEWPIVIALLAGLLAVKIGIIGGIAPFFGLSESESIRTGFLLSQGGEFAFVLLSLANELKVLPEDLNRLLIIVVVLSMALTPALAELGKWVAEASTKDDGADPGIIDTGGKSSQNTKDPRPIVICGFGELGQTLANMLESPFAVSLERGQVPYVAFDLVPARLKPAREAGFNVLYGDGSRPQVLRAAGVEQPRACVVVYTARGKAITAVNSLRTSYPEVPIYVRALDVRHAAELKAAGATHITVASSEAGLAMGRSVLEGLGANENSLNFLTRALRQQMDARMLDMVQESESSSPSNSSSDETEVFVFDQTLYSQDDVRSSYLQPPTNVLLSSTDNASSSMDAMDEFLNEGDQQQQQQGNRSTSNGVSQQPQPDSNGADGAEQCPIECADDECIPGGATGNR